jgi:hypothetical protein
MNERLVEDWLTKANERSYQTPFAQALISEGMQVLRVGHSPHEHGKDIITIDKAKKIHAYQLKDGDFDLKDFENQLGQINALVETPVEHAAVSGMRRHQPWLVISGEVSIPALDRIRVYNIQWRRRGFAQLKVIVGRQLLTMFEGMAANFWPQHPLDSNRLFTLYLADGKANLDREGFAKLIQSIVVIGEKSKNSEIARKLAAANLFTSYALSPFYGANNHWEIVQGWIITAAHIAWVAEETGLAEPIWRPTFRLAVNAALVSLRAFVEEALLTDALRPMAFCELDEITRSRNTICAGAIAINVLLTRHDHEPWKQESLARKTLEELFKNKRLLVWGESAVPFFLAITWSLDRLRSDQFSDTVLFATLSAVVNQTHGYLTPKLSNPYDSADDASAKLFRRVFKDEKAMELQAAVSYTLESLVTIVVRRMWRNGLSMFWSPITKIDLNRLVPDKPHDILLWKWGYERGANQARKYPPTQSWRELSADARRNEDDSLPAILKSDFDFSLLFLLCFPHRLSRALVKFFEVKVSS